MTLPSGAGDLTVDAAEGGTDGVSAADLVAQVVKQTNPLPADESGITHQGIEGSDVATIVVDPEKPAEAAPAVEEAETVETAGGEEVSLSEVQSALVEAGIDLDIDVSKLPKELLPAYEKLVESAIDIAQRSLSKELEASQLIGQVNEFKERLTSAPDKVLLSIALNQPEIWKKVVTMMSEADADPRMKEFLLRDLASEARLMEAERRERAMKEEYTRAKANRVIAETSRLARVHGVPYKLAEKMVANQVTANQGDIELSQVDEVVKSLAEELNKGKPVKQAVATVAKVVAARAAPTAPVGGSETTTTVTKQPGVSAGLKDGSSERSGGGGMFRNLVKGINARIREV